VENDQFVALARAHQLLQGSWPVRDFAYPGQPLTYLLSAAAAWLFGATLRTDVIVTITLLSLATSFNYLLAVRASASLFIAAAAVPWKSPPAAALQRRRDSHSARRHWFRLGYADSPSIRRLIALAAWTAAACLWRHHFIVYMAIPTILLLGVSHERARALRLATLYVAVTLAFLLPWFAYVQWSAGIVAYIGAAFRFAATEAQRIVTWPGNRAWCSRRSWRFP
jgi:hypothetical protein